MSTRDFAIDISDVPTPEPLRIRKVQSTISPKPTLYDHDFEAQLTQNSDAKQDGSEDVNSIRNGSYLCSPMPETPIHLQSRSSRMQAFLTTSGDENIKVTHDGQHIPDILSKGSKFLSRVITSLEGVKQQSLTTNASPSRILAEVSPSGSKSNLRSRHSTRYSQHSGNRAFEPPAERLERAVIQRNRASCSSCRSDMGLSIQKRHPGTGLTSTSSKTTHADVCFSIKRLSKLDGEFCLADIVVGVEAKISSLNQGSRMQRPSAALDVTVFVDNLSATNARIILDAALAVCGTLVPHYDRLSLYAIQPEYPHNLQCLLLSAPVYNTSTIKRCVDTIQFPGEDVSRNVDFSRVLVEVSRGASIGTRRNALAELIVITDKRSIDLPSECLLARLRVHTITLHPTCEVSTGSCVRGLHLALDRHHSKDDLRRRLHHMIDFIRADLSSGVLQSILAEITAVDDCLIDNRSHLLLEHQRLDAGERWSFPLSVRIGAYPELLSDGNVRCLRAVYEEGTSAIVRHDSRSLRPIPLFRLDLRYKHSQLPNSASVTTGLLCRLDIRPKSNSLVPGYL